MCWFLWCILCGWNLRRCSMCWVFLWVGWCFWYCCVICCKFCKRFRVRIWGIVLSVGITFCEDTKKLWDSVFCFVWFFCILCMCLLWFINLRMSVCMFCNDGCWWCGVSVCCSRRRGRSRRSSSLFSRRIFVLFGCIDWWFWLVWNYWVWMMWY